MLSEQDWALIKRIVPERSEQSIGRLYPATLKALLDAARAEGGATWDRSRACHAASVASQRFGTWVPQAWLTLFFDAYEAQR